MQEATRGKARLAVALAAAAAVAVGLSGADAREAVARRLPFPVFEEWRGATGGVEGYVARLPGGTLHLGEGGLALVLRGEPAAPAKSGGPPASEVLRLSWLGANRAARPQGVEPLPGRVNDFRGSDPSRWRLGVATVGRVEYRGLYPGVDLVHYVRQGEMEFDLVLAPGADPAVVRLRLEGAREARVDGQGDLRVALPSGRVAVLRRPVAYQEEGGTRREVGVRYRLRGRHTVSLQVGEHDRGRRLVIDPVLSYSTYLGGSGAETPRAMAVDSDGNVYLAGETWSADLPLAGAVQGTHGGGGRDAFVAKLDPIRSRLLFSTYLGGSEWDEALGLAVDASGNVLVTGRTYSDDFPTRNALWPARSGSADTFVAKLDPTGGALLYSTYLGGSLPEIGWGVAVDAAGNAYAAGWTSSGDFPTVRAFQPAPVQLGEAFVTKLSPDGQEAIYSTYLGGTGNETIYAIAVDQTGRACVTGVTTGGFPLRNSLQGFAGSSDAFVTCLEPGGGGLDFSTYLGGGPLGPCRGDRRRRAGRLVPDREHGLGGLPPGQPGVLVDARDAQRLHRQAQPRRQPAALLDVPRRQRRGR